MGSSQLIDPDQFALRFDDLDIDGIVNENLGWGADRHLLETTEAGTRTTHIPEVGWIAMIRKTDFNFDEDLEKRR